MPLMVMCGRSLLPIRDGGPRCLIANSRRIELLATPGLPAEPAGFCSSNSGRLGACSSKFSLPCMRYSPASYVHEGLERNKAAAPTMSQQGKASKLRALEQQRDGVEGQLGRRRPVQGRVRPEAGGRTGRQRQRHRRPRHLQPATGTQKSSPCLLSCTCSHNTPPYHLTSTCSPPAQKCRTSWFSSR